MRTERLGRWTRLEPSIVAKKVSLNGTCKTQTILPSVKIRDRHGSAGCSRSLEPSSVHLAPGALRRQPRESAFQGETLV